MAEYRRFVAYVYEYQKEKKGSNCGFVKVEVRSDVCRIELHLQCPGLIPESKCEVYGFVRNKGLLDGIFLGSCVTGEGSAECVLETSAEHMGDSERSLDEMGGMIFTTDRGGFFGTEWDDQMIRPGNFRKTEKRPISEMQTDLPETEQMQIEENTASEKETASKKETSETVDQKNDVTEAPESEQQDVKQTQIQQELHAQSVQETAQKAVRTCSVRPLPGTPCDAFSDGELSDCRKISPQDLCHFGRRACMLRNNRFVQYGSYNFGHLLLCRNKCGQMVLGIPGAYDQQERFMANMFGFPYFKESRHIQIPGGKGGYWYRLIDTPDFDKRDGRQ